ncbi:MAG TPA: AI-2E family transporter [Candidatus Limnocylindria bacterium]|nr:AI-2E family transporter [Candidatus Limnocylindria bacterium]
MLPPRVDEGMEPRERRWLLAFLILGSLYFATLLLQQAIRFLGGFSSILLVLFLAWLLAFVMAPLVGYLEQRIGLHRALAASIAYAVALVALGVLIFGLVSAVTEQVRQFGQTFPQSRIEETLASWQRSIDLTRFGLPSLVEIFQSLQASLGSIAGAVFAQAQAIAGATIGAIGSFVLILILSLYTVMDSERILSRVNRVVPRRYQDELEIFERTVARAFGGFLRAQLILVLFQAALVIVVWVIFGLPYVFLVATLSALAMFIPFFGPPLALIPPVVAAWVYGPAWWIPITVGLIAIQTVAVNWLQPRLMRGSLGMHPILVLVALLVGAQVAGVWGALFGIPVVAVLNVFLNYFLWSEVPNVALPETERLAHVDEATMVRVEKEQVSDETHPRIHVHRSLRADGGEEYEIVVDEDEASAAPGATPTPNATPSPEEPDARRPRELPDEAGL